MVSLAAAMVTAQTAPDKLKLEPTETQKLKLENAQLKIQVAWDQLQPAKQQYDQRLVEFFQLCDQVKKENGWDKGVTCNPQTLAFSPPKPAPAPSPAALREGDTIDVKVPPAPGTESTSKPKVEHLPKQ